MSEQFERFFVATIKELMCESGKYSSETAFAARVYRDFLEPRAALARWNRLKVAQAPTIEDAYCFASALDTSVDKLMWEIQNRWDRSEAQRGVEASA